MEILNPEATIHYHKIEDHPGYRVGDDGSVWSLWATGRPVKLGNIWRELKQWKHLYYLYVSFRQPQRSVAVHRVVLEAFVGPCPEGMECRHLDGNGHNNRLSNLRWGTRTQNARDRVAHGTQARGEKHGHAKISDEEVEQIRRICEAVPRPALRAVAKMFGITRQTVGSIISGRTRQCRSSTKLC